MAPSTTAYRRGITVSALRYLRQVISSSSSSKPMPRHCSRPKSSVSQTYYGLFPKTLQSGPPPGGPFNINNRNLKAEFLQLQARAHPDRHPPEKKSQAEALSSQINTAYKTLSDPLLRAQYLLTLHHGADVSSDEAAKLGGGHDSPGGEDAELLMIVMEAREAIEEASEEDELLYVKEDNEQRILVAIRLLEKAFKENNWDAAKRETVRLRYWIGIRDGIHNWVKKQ